ncbi:MAG: methionyl-tRNA formyltransferase [Bacteroidales bacterium]|nr:methionyl-tRNA formyltransferase [Bacteroidales bacterium]
MEKNDLRIVFMGTPDFAVASLKALVEGGYNVVGVITMPDKPSGRGYKIQYSPVKQYAIDHEITLLQPEKLKDTQFIDDLKSLNADLQIVVAFRMLPEVVWNMPRLGTFNLHGSLLPQYRGAAPINWAIINGETETGITTFFLTHEIDTGQVIFQEKITIGDEDNVEIIHDKLMILGAELVCKTVDSVLANKIDSIPQDEMINSTIILKSAPKIFKETCRIDWSKDIKTVYNFIRGLSPYPAAWSEITLPNETPQMVKIFSTEKLFENHNLAIGAIRTDGKKIIDVALSDGFLRIKSLQLAGKKKMESDDFLRGFRLTEEYFIR